MQRGSSGGLYTQIPDIETGLEPTPTAPQHSYSSYYENNNQHTEKQGDQHDDEEKQQKTTTLSSLLSHPECQSSVGWYEDVRVFAPSLTLISLFVGTIFYCWDNQWSLSTSFFYAVSTLFGVLFYLPVNKTWWGNMFTIFYYIYGAFFFAGVIGTYGGWLIAKAPEIYAEERRRMLAEEPEDLDGDGVVGVWDRLIYLRDLVAYKMGWEYHSSKYLTVGAVCLWVVVGTVYGVYYEGWTPLASTVFAISTISAAANIPPQCLGADTTNCEIGFFRELFLSIYMLIGCPLFTLALGQFAKYMIDRAVKQHEITILHTPITEGEFKYAATLYGDDPEVMSLGEFTILELLRLQRITMADLEQIKTLYVSIDENETGKVNKPMLVTRNWMRPYGSFDETMLSSHKTSTCITTGGGTATESGDDEQQQQQQSALEELHVHMLTENDRANSLPPGEITHDMYRSVDVNFMNDDDELMLLHQQYCLESDLCERSQYSQLTPHTNTPHIRGERHCTFTFPQSPSLHRRGSGGSSMFDIATHEQEEQEEDSQIVPMGIKRFGFEEYNEIVVPLAVSTALEGPGPSVSAAFDDEDARGGRY
jgi:hypothetical protein